MIQSRRIEQTREINGMLGGIHSYGDLPVRHEGNGRLTVPPFSAKQSPVRPPGARRRVEGDTFALQLFGQGVDRDGFIPAGPGFFHCVIERLRF